MRRTRTVVSIVTMSVFLAFSFCSKKSPTETEYKYDGDWAGTTSQGNPISFTVRNDEIIFFAINVSYSNGRIEGDEHGELGTIDKDTFDVTLYWPKTIRIHGTFTNSTSCTGTYSLSGGSGRWTTTKN